MTVSEKSFVALEDLKGSTEQDIKDHIAQWYSGSGSYNTGSNEERSALRRELEPLELIIAYESEGSWGCDSSSFFLFRKPDGTLLENNASHCSCYGFEGQWSPEETTKETLQRREFRYDLGGYDGDKDGNPAAMKAAVDAL